MTIFNNVTSAIAASAIALLATSVFAHEIEGATGNAKDAAFDIIKTGITVNKEKNWVEFAMQVSGKAGSVKPKKKGAFDKAAVFSYVWPTKIDPKEVGFDASAGTLALAVTVHPDFDDTPLFATKGSDWHTHWVVLGPDEACGKGALKVKDIPEGSHPRLPKTWPGVPLLIDSPGYAPNFDNQSVMVRVPFDNIDNLIAVGFDGVTAGLRINASPHNPLLCVVNVFDVASGDLSFPGRIK